jgi:UDP-2,3-diacylglucosamine pyrophosphatase LpxH
MTQKVEPNLLIISDLHLGEDIRPDVANMSYLRHLVKLERALADFLTHHAQNRIGDRPWKLVVNGDMVDFMSIKLLPEEVPGGEDANEDERLYGLGFGERQSQKKLERVIVRHQEVFRRLAEFVGAGNELVIVVGNHDPEFHYPSVQRTLVEWLCGLAVGAGADEDVRAAFAARIQFCPWFFYQENLIYVEHGHQYDEYCSIDYMLHPVATDQGGKKSGIALSIAHAGMRYFANQLPHYNPHTAEHWGFFDYMKWGLAQGLRGLLRLCYFYGLLVWRVVEGWYVLRSADDGRRKVHEARLLELSAQWRLAEDKVRALDGLRREPVTRRLWRLIAALFLDRVLLGMVALGTAAALGTNLHGWWRIAGPLGAILLFAFLNAKISRWRLRPAALKLRATTNLIQSLVCAPFIVFGHSHAPESVTLETGATYFNTGTWASDDPAHAFTHVLVTHGEQPTAELRQWKNGGSAPYTPSKT